MKVKVFTANTMNEAVAQVKNELGRDAVILHTRRFRRGGFLGFFAREMVEVMAAIDTPQPSTIEHKTVLPPPVRSGEEETRMTALQLEVANMRKTLEQLLAKLPEGEPQNSVLLTLMEENDIDVEIAKNILQGMPDKNSVIQDPGVIRRLLLDRIANCLQRVEAIRIPASGVKTVALIGPTGVGKTTTIAKLAANFALKEGCRVAMVTADTYRIAAVEQLKTYADIIGVPIDIVYSPDELKAALYRHRDKNLVLIDTAGRSPRNQYQLSELQALLAVDPYIETHLVLSATTKYKDALEIVRNFSLLSPQKFLFTKLDEASNLGLILNILYQFPAMLSYITTGQNVPEDIELANAGKLANLILRDQ